MDSYRAVNKKEGEPCPKCKTTMERRSHADLKKFLTRRVVSKPGVKYYYSEWDYCPSCKYVQHYEKFKNLIPLRY